MVTYADIVRDNGALVDKLTNGLMGRMGIVGSETGHLPVCAKVSFQMPDDSVFELRAEPCPDGCGQVRTIASAAPELSSLHDRRPVG